MTTENFSPDALHVVVIATDVGTVELIQSTLAGSGDEFVVASDLAEGLARVASDAPDAVLVDVALGHNAGLAVVHHARAVSPTAAVYALVSADSLALGAQAIALGSTGVLMLPLSGDELLTALAEVRGRRAERDLRAELEREADVARREAAILGRLVQVAEANTRREAAANLLPLIVEAGRTHEGLLYIPAGEGSRQLMRVAAVGALDAAPSFCEELELLDFANTNDLEVLRLSLRQEQSGMVLLGQSASARASGALLELLASQGAAALALIAERERSHRSAMKDPQSSAYTFAYFVDVAGREIDKARRHGRRFALATIALNDESLHQSESAGAPTELVERVLSVVRDTDVLARVDEGEFYLLMPETGGVGAHICRRRVMRELLRAEGLRRPERTEVDVMMGVATYPHDGRDLSQLLRVAKHRADASQHSLVWRANIARAPLSHLYEEVARASEAGGGGPSGLWRLALPSVDLLGLATAAVAEAARGGNVRIVATQRPGVSVGAAVRGAIDRDLDRELARVDIVDLGPVEGCNDLEALAVIAQHGAYALLGRVEGTMVYAAHAGDPLLVDLLIDRIGEATGNRLGE